MSTYKKYENFETFTAADANILMRQGLIPVGNAAERDDIDNPTEGIQVYRLDTKRVERFNGSIWVRASWHMQLGTATLPATAAATFKTATVTFPVAFSAAPHVILDGSHIVAANGVVVVGHAASVTSTGFTLRVARADAQTFTAGYTFPYIAIEI